MREIKFRAWDKKTKEWVDHVGIASGSPRSDCGTFEIYEAEAWPDSNDCDCYDVDPKDVVLMQYTGLKDKNGKEIYEGDICQYFLREYHQMEKFVAEISKSGLENIEMMIYYGGKVIGNIYENPELLKETK